MTKINEQKKKFEESVFYKNNNFTMTVTGKRNGFYLDEFAISEVSYDDRHIILTVRDVCKSNMIENELDKMKLGKFNIFNKKKKELNVSLLKISSTYSPLYAIRFEKCYIEGYESVPYTYNNGQIHTFTVKIRYKKRSYELMVDIMNEIRTEKLSTNTVFGQKNPDNVKYEQNIIKYANEMLDSCRKDVKRKMDDGAVSEKFANNTIDQINKAINDNEKMLDVNSKQTKIIQKHIFDSKLNKN